MFTFKTRKEKRLKKEEKLVNKYFSVPLISSRKVNEYYQYMMIDTSHKYLSKSDIDKINKYELLYKMKKSLNEEGWKEYHEKRYENYSEDESIWAAYLKQEQTKMNKGIRI